MEKETREILWIDDEIESLKSHILLLGEKGYKVTPISNGDDALSLLKEEHYDAILLDQMMPGHDGMTTLELIRQIEPRIPVIMVTQVKDDQLINEALSKRVSDFLLKPLTSTQVVSTLKRVLDQVKIIRDQLPHKYMRAFNEIRLERQESIDWRKWIQIHLRLSEWDLEFDQVSEAALEEIHSGQKKEYNALFAEYVIRNYPNWLKGKDSPALSVDLIHNYIVPLLNKGNQVYFIVLDCLRLDQWLVLEPMLEPYFDISRDYYYSILPTATLYSRNAIFSGLFPDEIAERYPQYWQETTEDETSTNRYEKRLLELKLESFGFKLKPALRYFKIFDVRGGEEYLNQVNSFNKISLAALVVNFIDILAHKRSQLDILQQIAPNESAFRTLTKSWFMHSSLFEILKVISQKNSVCILTSDHGSILGNRASKVFGNKETTTSLRFKMGNNLGCDDEEALLITDPKSFKLPADSMGKNYILAKEDYYFVYPNQFHEYSRQFKGGFQHGGISMEELILPCVTMRSKVRR